MTTRVGCFSMLNKATSLKQKKETMLKEILKGFSVCFSSEVINKPHTEYCFLHIMEGSKLSHWFQWNEMDL